MESFYLYFLAIFPAVFILFYFLLSDKFKEPKKLIFYTFLYGVVMTFLVGVVKAIIYELGFDPNPFLEAFVDAAFIEELGKFIVLYFFCSRFTEFNEPMDGIVYGTAVALSFAVYENLEYVFASDNYATNYYTAYVRALTALPMHAFCGVIMGDFIGKHFFIGKNDKKNLYYAFLVPFLIHGAYNYPLMEDDLHHAFSWFVLLAALTITIILHKQAVKRQELKEFEHEKKNYR